MPKVSSAKFFQEQKAHSQVKSLLVSKFVPAWLRVVLNFQRKHGWTPKAAYIDLFAGPGSYEDGNDSTPLLVLKAVLRNPLACSGLQAYFNDSDGALVASLKQEIAAIPGIEALRNPPMYTNAAVSSEFLDTLRLEADTPQFFFLDQFGWSAIKPDFIKKMFKARMCDCAFFLRTSRMIAAISNHNTTETMQQIIGVDGALRLRTALASKESDKEALLLSELQSILKGCGVNYFLPFPFRIHEEHSSKHHLIYLGKHERGFGIMKDIMAKESSINIGGVSVIGFSERLGSLSLFEIDPIKNLQYELLSKFAGRTLTVGSIFMRHHPNTHYLLRNHQEALRRLESLNRISVSPPAIYRRSRNGIISMGESTTITFPS